MTCGILHNYPFLHKTRVQDNILQQDFGSSSSSRHASDSNEVGAPANFAALLSFRFVRSRLTHVLGCIPDSSGQILAVNADHLV